MIKGDTHPHLEPIGYHSEPSDVPYSPNQFLGWDFFCRFLQQDSSRKNEDVGLLQKGFQPIMLYIIIQYNKCQSGFQGSAYGDFDAC